MTLHTHLLTLIFGTALILGLAVWTARDWIRANPYLAKLIAVILTCTVGGFTTVMFFLAALLQPASDYTLITSYWDDPSVFAQMGFSDQGALLITGIGIGVLTMAVYYLAIRLDMDRLGSVRDRARDRFHH